MARKRTTDEEIVFLTDYLKVLRVAIEIMLSVKVKMPPVEFARIVWCALDKIGALKTPRTPKPRKGQTKARKGTAKAKKWT